MLCAVSIQEECKSLEEFSGIPLAKLRENDPSLTKLDFSSKGFGIAEACVLAKLLEVNSPQKAHFVA